jgi:hypothetical protein
MNSRQLLKQAETLRLACNLWRPRTKLCWKCGTDSNKTVKTHAQVTVRLRVTSSVHLDIEPRQVLLIMKVTNKMQLYIYIYIYFFFFFFAQQPPSGPRPPHSRCRLDYTQLRTTVDSTPLDEWSARRRDLYLTTHTTDRHPCPRWDSNPQSQQASGLRPRAHRDRQMQLYRLIYYS